MVFFVGGSVVAKGNKFQFNSYLQARLSKLWVVLIPALMFTVIIDQIITLTAPSILSGDYNSTLNSGPNEDGGYSLSIETFLANVVFLQNTYAPVFGANGALWSLANEFWYYILFPAAIMLIDKGQIYSITKKIFLTLAIMLIITFIASNMMQGFLIWLFGVIVYLAYSKDNLTIPSWGSLPITVIFIVSLADSKALIIDSITGISNDVILGLCFSLFLFSIKGKSVGHGKKCLSLSSKWLSEISYTLYLFHFPIVLLIYSVYYKDNQIVLDLMGIIQYILWLILLLVISYIMWFAFERNTPLVRQYLQKHLKLTGVK